VEEFGGPPRDRTEDPLIKSAGQNASQRKCYAKLQAFQSFLFQLIRHHRKLHAAACGQKADKNLLSRLIHDQVYQSNRLNTDSFFPSVRALPVSLLRKMEYGLWETQPPKGPGVSKKEVRN